MGSGISMSKGWTREAKDVQTHQAGPFCIIRRPGTVFGYNHFVVWTVHGLFVKFPSQEKATVFLTNVVNPVLIPLLSALTPTNIDFVLTMTKKTNKKLHSPLHVAVKAASEGKDDFSPIIPSLLSFINQGDREGLTPVHLASSSVRTLGMVLQAREPAANVDSVSKEGITPLHVAAAYNVECVRLLLQHRARVAVVDKKGYNPLHSAAVTGQAECLTLIVQAAGSTNLVNQANMAGDTPLHCVMQNGHRAAMVVLLQYGANPNIYNFQKETALHMSVSGKASPEMLNDFLRLSARLPPPNSLNVLLGQKQSLTVLHLATQRALHQHVEQIVLHAHPAVINMVNRDGDTALHMAASEERLGAVLEVLLRSRWVFLNGLSARDNGTALHKLAAGQGSVQMCERLLRARADVHARDNRGRTALHLACAKPGRVKLIETLVSHGALACAIDASGVRPFDLLNAADKAQLGGLLAQGAPTLLDKQNLVADARRCEQRHSLEMQEQQRMEAECRALSLPQPGALPPMLVPPPEAPPPYTESELPFPVSPPPGCAPPANGLPNAVIHIAAPASSSSSSASLAPLAPLASSAVPLAAPASSSSSSSSSACAPVSTGEDGKECVVCLAAGRTAVLVPCGHALFCHPCATALFNRRATCPCCNSPIQMAVKLFQ